MKDLKIIASVDAYKVAMKRKQLNGIKLNAMKREDLLSQIALIVAERFDTSISFATMAIYKATKNN